MVRTVTRRLTMRSFAVVVVTAMLVPFTVASVSPFFHGTTPGIIGAVSSSPGGFLGDGRAEDDIEFHDTGSFGTGMNALGESFVPELIPPAASASVSPASFDIHSSPHLPRIFRPPIG
jgi:hypothetical protein